jgi:hypothetical protein
MLRWLCRKTHPYRSCNGGNGDEKKRIDKTTRVKEQEKKGQKTEIKGGYRMEVKRKRSPNEKTKTDEEGGVARPKSLATAHKGS